MFVCNFHYDLQKYLQGYASKQPRFKLLKNVETTDLWYRDDGIKLRQEYGVLYVRSVLTGIKKIMDKGGVSSEPSSLTGSLEKDMR
jgi:hypothetical protein